MSVRTNASNDPSPVKARSHVRCATAVGHPNFAASWRLRRASNERQFFSPMCRRWMRMQGDAFAIVLALTFIRVQHAGSG
jgi:hypothetical protein